MNYVVLLEVKAFAEAFSQTFVFLLGFAQYKKFCRLIRNCNSKIT